MSSANKAQKSTYSDSDEYSLQLAYLVIEIFYPVKEITSFYGNTFTNLSVWVLTWRSLT